MYRSNRSCLRLERIVLTLYINLYVSPYFGLAKVAEFNHLSYNIIKLILLKSSLCTDVPPPSENIPIFLSDRGRLYTV